MFITNNLCCTISYPDKDLYAVCRQHWKNKKSTLLMRLQSRECQGISLQDGQGFLDRQVKRKNVYKVGRREIALRRTSSLREREFDSWIGANGTRLAARIYCAWTCFHLPFPALFLFALSFVCLLCGHARARDSVRYRELCKERGEREKRGRIGNGTGTGWRRGSSHLATHLSDSDSLLFVECC